MSGVIACLAGLGLVLLGLQLIASRGALLIARSVCSSPAAAPWGAVPGLVLLQSPTTAQSLLASLGNSGCLYPATALSMVCWAELGLLLSLWLGVFGGELWVPGLTLLALSAVVIAGRRQALLAPVTALLAGFGCTLLGLNLIHAGLAELASGWEFPPVLRLGPLAAVAWVSIGVALAVFTRAPGAIMAMAAAAVDTGLLSLSSGGCTWVGATAGGALLALGQALQSTPSARRLALAHAGADFLLVLVQLALLPMLLLADEALPEPWSAALRLGLLASVALLLWGALMTPLAASTGQWLGQRMAALRSGGLQYLDQHSMRHPLLSEGSLQLEWQQLAQTFEEAVRAHWQGGSTAGEGLWAQLEQHIDALEQWLAQAVAEPDGVRLLAWRDSWMPLLLFARQQPPSNWPQEAVLPPESHDVRYRYQESVRRAMMACTDPERLLEGTWEALLEKRERYHQLLLVEAEAQRIRPVMLSGELQRLCWLDAACQSLRQARLAL